MRVTLTAVGTEHWGLADPILHYLASVGATLAEVQMYDHGPEGASALLARFQWPGTPPTLADLRGRMAEIGRERGLSIRAWAPGEHDRPPRLALCTTYRPEPAAAVLQAIRDGRLRAEAVALVGNRPHGRAVAEQFGVPWQLVGDAAGNPDHERMVQVFDECEADYIVLARYMRLVPPSVCSRFAGGRIINLHHGLLPAFPGARPYHDAYSHRMLTFGATVHFIVPELDAGEQIIHQDTFTVPPGTPLAEIIRQGEREHEPRCLVEGLRRVVGREVELHYHKVVAAAQRPGPAPGPAAPAGRPDGMSGNAVACLPLLCPKRPPPRLEAPFSLPPVRGGLGSYLLAWTVPLSFCSGLLGLAVSAQFAVAVPRWFILAYGAGCAVVSLLALLLCRPWQRLRGSAWRGARPAGSPDKGGPLLAPKQKR
jgi:formyltetrahydrofolate deformylase